MSEAISLDEDLTDEVICAVCEVPLKNSPSYRITKPACDACKKFFWRNRNTDLNSLICVTQYGGCDVVGCVGPNSNVRRPICAHCRLAKCYAIGMQSKKTTNKGKIRKKRNKTSVALSSSLSTNESSESQQSSKTAVDDVDEKSKASSSSSDDNEEASSCQQSMLSSDEAASSSSITTMAEQQQQQNQTPCLSTLMMTMQKPLTIANSNGDAENISAEKILRVASEAVVELSPLQSMPWTISYEPVDNDVGVWSWAMKNFMYGIEYGFSFIRHLSEIADLPSNDKNHLFAFSINQIAAAQLALSRNPTTMFFGMNPQTRADFARFFPTFKSIERRFEDISLAFAAWNPDFLEFAILQALLFFRVDLLYVLERPDLVVDANQRLMSVMSSLVKRSDQSNVKLENFHRVVEMLRSFQLECIQVLFVTLANRSDLLQINQLWAEIYFTAFADQNNCNRQQHFHQPQQQP